MKQSFSGIGSAPHRRFQHERENALAQQSRAADHAHLALLLAQEAAARSDFVQWNVTPENHPAWRRYDNTAAFLWNPPAAADPTWRRYVPQSVRLEHAARTAPVTGADSGD